MTPCNVGSIALLTPRGSERPRLEYVGWLHSTWTGQCRASAQRYRDGRRVEVVFGKYSSDTTTIADPWHKAPKKVASSSSLRSQAVCRSLPACVHPCRRHWS